MKPGLRLSALAALAAGASVGFGAPSASAASGDVEYSCTFSVLGTEGEGVATGSFDTGVPDGFVLGPGDPLPLSPFGGTLTLPDAMTDLLRAGGQTTVTGSEHVEEGLMPGGTGENYMYLDGKVPAEGSMTVNLGFAPRDPRPGPEAPGTYTIVLGRLAFPLEGGIAGIGAFRCDPVDGDAVIVFERTNVVAVDTFRVAGPATSTPSAAVSDTPVRPVLVQTDFAEEEEGVPPLLGVVALLALAAGGLGLTRRRAASPRH
jgi:hypothetical protein